MSTELVSLTFDATRPLRLARFWADALGWRLEDGTPGALTLVPEQGPDPAFVFVPVPEPKRHKNRLHIDLVAESVEDQAALVARLVERGAQPAQVGQPDDADHVVLTDPEGNELCVVTRGNFLVGTGRLGAIAFEPANPTTGHFWSAATGWPVVHDQDGDVAVRNASGTGPFLTFGPPGVPAKTAKNRLRPSVAPAEPAGDLRDEVERLLALGATRAGIGRDAEIGPVVLADPDGNEFSVEHPR